MGKKWKQWQILFSWAPKSPWTVTAAMKFKRLLLLGRKAMTNLESILKSRDITLLTKGLSSQSYNFSSSHVWIWELDHKEGWVPKNWCFQIVMLEKTFESPLDFKEIQPVNPKGNKPWIFTGRTGAEAGSPILWPPDAKSWLNGKDWRWERLSAREEGGNRGWNGWMASPTQWTWVWTSSGGAEGQGSLVCCSSWDHKESDMT